MAHLSGRAFDRVVVKSAALSAVPHFLAALLLFAGAAAAQEKRLTFATPDGPRFAILDNIGAGPRPALIVLHGATVGAYATLVSSGFRAAARAHGFVSVFPEGVDRVWRDGRGMRPGVDDRSFLLSVAQRLAVEGIADPKRIYLAGISNGGIMALDMACGAADVFAGVGTAIAALAANTGAACSGGRPLPVVMVAGSADGIVPYEGGSVNVGFFHRRQGEVWGVERTAAFFAQRAKCGAPAQNAVEARDADDPAVTRIAYACPAQTPVAVYRVEGGGHQMFGGVALPETAFGRTTRGFSAAEAIVAAFAAAAR